MKPVSSRLKALRDRFIAELEVDYTEFEKLVDPHQALTDFVRSLHTDEEDRTDCAELDPGGKFSRTPPRGSTGGPLDVASTFEDEPAWMDRPQGASPWQSALRPLQTGQGLPYKGRARYRSDPHHVSEESIRRWADYEQTRDDYLAEIRMSGDGGGDVLMPAPVPPCCPYTSAGPHLTRHDISEEDRLLQDGHIGHQVDGEGNHILLGPPDVREG